MIASLGPLPKGDKSVAKYRQISAHLRQLINRGDLVPGTRLPGMIALAKQWKTNYFTVRLALTPLANEGLIKRTPRGSFVSGRNLQITSVALYYGTNPWDDPEGSFFQQVYREIRKELTKRQIQCHLYMDNRETDEQHSPLPGLMRGIERREIQGVIGLMLTSTNRSWLEKLPVPKSLLASNPQPAGLEPTIMLALDRLARDGCKTVGLIHPAMRDLYPEFRKAVEARGMKTEKNWLKKRSDPRVFRGEQFGYQEFKKLWAQKNRPRGLFIMPDWVCRGAVTAILELGIQVPKQLSLVLFCNAGLEFVCPWRLPMMVSDGRKTAGALVRHLMSRDPLNPVYEPVSNPLARLVG